MIDINELRRLAQAAISKMNARDPEFASSVTPLAVLELLDRLEAAEKNAALLERLLDARGSSLNAVANECDTLRAKIKQIERQEPVAWMSSRNGFICKENKNPDYNVPLKRLDLGTQAQPATSVPDKVEVREDKEGEIFSRGSYNEGYDNGWNDCIDAMLAAAPNERSEYPEAK